MKNPILIISGINEFIGLTNISEFSRDMSFVKWTIIEIIGLIILILIPIILIRYARYRKKNLNYIERLQSGKIPINDMLLGVNKFIKSYYLQPDEAKDIFDFLRKNNRLMQSVNNVFQVKYLQILNDKQIFFITTFINKKTMVFGGYKYVDFCKIIFEYKPEEGKATFTSNFIYQTNPEKFALQGSCDKLMEFLKMR